MEYEFTIPLGENADVGFIEIQNISIKPENGYKIKKRTYTDTKAKIYFNKDIPDGSIITISFCDSKGNYILTHTFTKGAHPNSVSE